MTKLQALVTGDSHMLCLGRANEQEGPLHDRIHDDDRIVITRLRPPSRAAKVDGSYWDDTLSRVDGKIAILSWKGNQHVVGALFPQGVDFDILVPEDDQPPVPGAQLIPYKVAWAWFDKSVAALPATLERLRAAGATRILMIGTPPPKANSEALLEKVRRSPTFKVAAKSIGIDASTTDCLTTVRSRYKLWRVLQARYAHIAAENGGEFLSCPENILEEDGAFKAEFAEGDITHGNRKYGVKMLNRIVEYLTAEAA